MMPEIAKTNTEIRVGLGPNETSLRVAEYWTSDKWLVFLASTTALFALVAFLVLLAPPVDLLLNYLGLQVEPWIEIRQWLFSGNQGLMVMASCAVVAIIFLFLTRRRMQRNQTVLFAAGCPNCHQNKLLIVPNRRRDFTVGFLGIPLARANCRNCHWQGIRATVTNGRRVRAARPVPPSPKEETTKAMNSRSTLQTQTFQTHALRTPTIPIPEQYGSTNGAITSSAQSYSVMRSLTKRWWVILLIGLITVGTLHSINVLADPVYQSSVTLQVNAPSPQDAPLFAEYGRPGLETQIQQERTGFADFVEESGVIYRDYRELSGTKSSTQELRDNISVEIPDDSDLLLVHARGSNPEESAQLANAIVDIALARFAELQARPTMGNRAFVEAELQAAEGRLSDAEEKLRQFRLENGIGELNKNIDQEYALIRGLLDRRNAAVLESDLFLINQLDKMIAEREEHLEATIDLGPQYQRLVDQLNIARDEKNFLLEKLGESLILERQILDKGSIEIVAAADPPRKPLPGINPRLLILGGVAGILAGVLFVVLLDYLENVRRMAKREESLAILGDGYKQTNSNL